jgi:hypothetical protein
MRTILFVICLLALPSVVQAQHPCDVTSPASVQTKSPPTAFGACWDGKDVDGNAATPTALKVFIDGTVVKTVNNPTPSGAPNAAGLSYYSTSGVAVSKGARVLTVVIATADGDSDPSTAYTFSVVGGKPSKPVGARVEPR